MNWLILSFTGLLSLSLMSFLITVLAKKGYPVPFILLGIAIVVTLCYFFQTFLTHQYKVITPTIFGLFIITGILSVIGNVTVYQAAKDAPNAGLAIGIAGMQSVVVASLAFIFLKDKMTNLQMLGVILSIVAIFLMSMGSSKSSSKQQIAQSKNITARK